MRDVILALDFDGVIWDSVGECYVTARRAWRERFGETPEVDEGAFRGGRWLVRTGGEFGLVVALLLEGRELEDLPKDEFGRLAAERAAWVKGFEKEFYLQRDLARERDLPAWLDLQRPYPEVVAELPALREAFRELVICTTKDEASTRDLLRTRGLEMPVLGKEFSQDKRDQMRHLAETRGLEPSSIVFLDDLLHNLEPVRKVGVRVGLAGWGYNTPAERSAAGDLGIPVVRAGHLEEDVRERILGGGPGSASGTNPR